MEPPRIRPGRVSAVDEPSLRVTAHFRNSAQGNAVIQLLVGLGVPSDQLGVLPPEHLQGGQGMVLSIGCPDSRLAERVEAVCKAQGAEVHRSPA